MLHQQDEYVKLGFGPCLTCHQMKIINCTLTPYCCNQNKKQIFSQLCDRCCVTQPLLCVHSSRLVETAAAHKLTTRQVLLAASTLAQSIWSAVSFTLVIFNFFFLCNSGRNICCSFSGWFSHCCTQGWLVSFSCGHLSQRWVVWIAYWRCLPPLSCKRKLIECRLESNNSLRRG